jgi:hypothetical protein
MASIGRSKLAGQAAEKLLARQYGGAQQVTLKTSFARRVVDNLAEGVAMEAKVGLISLTRRIRSQIAKDVELMNKGLVDAVQWHFFPGQTGTGPTAPLRQALEEAGIEMIISSP